MVRNANQTEIASFMQKGHIKYAITQSDKY